MKTPKKPDERNHSILWQILTADKHLRALARELMTLSQNGQKGVLIRCAEVELHSVSISATMHKITAFLDQLDKKFAGFQLHLDWKRGLILTTSIKTSLKEEDFVQTTIGELLAKASN